MQWRAPDALPTTAISTSDSPFLKATRTLAELSMRIGMASLYEQANKVRYDEGRFKCAQSVQRLADLFPKSDALGQLQAGMNNPHLLTELQWSRVFALVVILSDEVAAGICLNSNSTSALNSSSSYDPLDSFDPLRN